jgi:hypothetical protein
MPVIINLREIFATDSQSEISNKLNFNFNQLLELGFGQIGPQGPQGATGAAGPVGPEGPQGPQGTVIFSNSTTTSSTPGVIPPSGMVLGDLLITQDKIWKKNLNDWTQVSDFNQLVVNALGVNISPYVGLAPNSRVIKPRLNSGLDLTNSVTSTDPNYATPGLGQNYQTVLYNFNELRTQSVSLNNTGSIVISTNSSTQKSFSPIGGVNLSTNEITITAHGFSTGTYVTYSSEGGTPVAPLTNFTGYYIIRISDNTIKLAQTYEAAIAGNAIDFSVYGTGSLHRLIPAPPSPDKVFPATANLMLYSFFNGTADPAKEFATANKGYKHQLELGSLDTLTTAYEGVTVAAQAFVISPSFENLRLKKYRITGSPAWTNSQGSYMLRAEYDISSQGITSASSESFSPRRNSEQVWKINKAEGQSADSRIIEMRLTNSNILQYLESSSSTLVDGIFLKKGPSVNDADSYSFGLGFHPTILSQVLFDSSNNITAFKYRGVQVEITRNSDELGTVITPTSIANNTNGDFTISSQGTSKIQLTDTRLLERLDFGFDENLTALNSLSPFNITNPGPLLTLIPLTSNYRLTSNKNVIRLGKRQQDLGNVTSNSINIASITNADVGTVIYVVAGESNPTYNIICSYLTPPTVSSFQDLNNIPIVDRSYSNKTVTLVQNTIIKFTLVQRWFYFGPLFGSISWKYWYMENLDGESFALSNRATALETRATSLETRATNLETRSTNLESPMTNWVSLTETNPLLFNSTIQYRKNIITNQVFFRGDCTVDIGFPAGNNVIGQLPVLPFPNNTRPSSRITIPVAIDASSNLLSNDSYVVVETTGEVRFVYQPRGNTGQPAITYKFFMNPVTYFTN